MSDIDNARIRAEAMNEPVGRALRSARRAQLWAGLNRYLASEAAHARRPEPAAGPDEAKHKEKEKDEEKDEETGPGAGEPE